jgi:hypothetical protein
MFDGNPTEVIELKYLITAEDKPSQWKNKSKIRGRSLVCYFPAGQITSTATKNQNAH